jgi:hypothetical protein
LLSCLPAYLCLSLCLCCSHPVRLGVASLSSSITATSRPRLSVPGRLTTLFHLPPPTLSNPSALPPTKSRGRIPPPSHPASAQHASIRRNRPSILDPLHSALLLLRVDHSPPPTDASAIILIRLPTHFASGARLFCLHPRTAVLPAGTQSYTALPCRVHHHYCFFPPPAHHSRLSCVESPCLCLLYYPFLPLGAHCHLPATDITHRLELRPCMHLSRTSKHQLCPYPQARSHPTSRHTTPGILLISLAQHLSV